MMQLKRRPPVISLAMLGRIVSLLSVAAVVGGALMIAKIVHCKSCERPPAAERLVNAR